MEILPLPPAEDLRHLFAYDVLKGELIWSESPGRRVKAGSIAGNVTKKGYRKVVIDGKSYKAHRLIWKWVYGTEPRGELDHRDQEGLPIKQNHIWHLREVTKRKHSTITHAHYKTSDLPVGAYLDKNRYQARITQDGKGVHLGSFDTPEEAHQAYVAALQVIENGDQVVSAAKPQTSRCKGVSWNKSNQKWQAYTRVDGKQKHLGYFLTEEEAHQAYLRVILAV